MSEKNIYQRINEVMKSVEYVQKDSKVSGGGTYTAVSHDMVVAVLRKAMVKHGIVVRTEQLRGDILQMRDIKNDIKMHLYSADYAVHFVNIDKPDDFCTVNINAHANDNGDKAPGKAASYAVKYAMLKTFSLETGDNDESRVAVDDLTEISQLISSAEDIDALQATFKMAWHSYPKSRNELTAIKDARKKELTQ